MRTVFAVARANTRDRPCGNRDDRRRVFPCIPIVRDRGGEAGPSNQSRICARCVRGLLRSRLCCCGTFDRHYRRRPRLFVRLRSRFNRVDHRHCSGILDGEKPHFLCNQRTVSPRNKTTALLKIPSRSLPPTTAAGGRQSGKDKRRGKVRIGSVERARTLSQHAARALSATSRRLGGRSGIKRRAVRP